MRLLIAVCAGLVLAVAPVAEAASKRPAAFRVTTLKASKSSVVAGETVRASGRVKNRRAARAQRAHITFTLRTTRASRRGARLGARTVRRIRGGRARTFSARLRIPATTAAGRYYLSACVRPRRARCKHARITITTPVTTTPSPQPQPDTRSPSEKLRAAVSSEGMLNHLRAFQEIADQNGGNRASGFPGYGASVQYVITQLRAAGYSPSTQVFEFVVFSEDSEPTFQLTAPPPTRGYVHETEFQTLSYSASGNWENTYTLVDEKLVQAERASTTSGCEDSDFAAFTPGDIAVIQRGSCTFYEKALNAQEAGAGGVVIFNQGNDAGRMGVVAGTLGEEAQDGDATEPDITIPVIGTTYDIGADLAARDATADEGRINMVVDADNDRRTSTNVLADTAGGNANRVVVVGSHLDSVQEGPGINDNGSGSAFNLELAIQMGRLGIQPVNKVRFAFWGAEESGLIGATRYVAALSGEALGQLAANLNFDMLASPNHGKFVYDGDFSDSSPPATAPNVNEGAARIEREFVQYFDSQGIPTEPTAFDGRSDYKPFQDKGIAAGGLFSGAEAAKTAEQQLKWGGQAGVPFDPNYHQAGDTITNLDLAGYEQMADGGAHVAAVLAHDPGLRNVGGGSVAASGAKSQWLGTRTQR
jgi:Zn-dependent M28 family amino/carboxypeptidase